MVLQQALIPLMAVLAVGGVAYAIAQPYLDGSATAQKRKAALQNRTVAKGANRGMDAAKRRKQVADSLKELDQKSKSKKLTFETKMAQAGLTWTRSFYTMLSIGLALLLAAVCFFAIGNPLGALAGALVGGFGMPAWIVSKMRKRRLAKFLKEFPAAVDVIVRGIKAGIPLGDCIRNIANEAAEPVRTEFKAIVDTQAMGLGIPEAVERLTERVPLAEANFFAIVINIQSKAGGNLSEALTNLSNVLRDRKKMKGKVKAMSSEAKASAGIIGALPPLVGGAVYLTAPGYMGLLFSSSTGHMVLLGCACWMGMGVFVMKKMISFDI